MKFNHVSRSESRIFWEFFPSYGDLFCTEGFIDFSEFCSGEYLSQVSIETLTDVVSYRFYKFHTFLKIQKTKYRRYACRHIE